MCMLKNTMSRTTITIPERDLKRLKALAAIEGKTVREIVAGWIHGNLYGDTEANAPTTKIAEKEVQELFRKLGI